MLNLRFAHKLDETIKKIELIMEKREKLAEVDLETMQRVEGSADPCRYEIDGTISPQHCEELYSVLSTSRLDWLSENPEEESFFPEIDSDNVTVYNETVLNFTTKLMDDLDEESGEELDEMCWFASEKNKQSGGSGCKSGKKSDSADKNFLTGKGVHENASSRQHNVQTGLDEESDEKLGEMCLISSDKNHQRSSNSAQNFLTLPGKGVYETSRSGQRNVQCNILKPSIQHVENQSQSVESDEDDIVNVFSEWYSNIPFEEHLRKYKTQSSNGKCKSERSTQKSRENTTNAAPRQSSKVKQEDVKMSALKTEKFSQKIAMNSIKMPNNQHMVTKAASQLEEPVPDSASELSTISFKSLESFTSSENEMENIKPGVDDVVGKNQRRETHRTDKSENTIPNLKLCRKNARSSSWSIERMQVSPLERTVLLERHKTTIKAQFKGKSSKKLVRMDEMDDFSMQHGNLSLFTPERSQESLFPAKDDVPEQDVNCGEKSQSKARGSSEGNEILGKKQPIVSKKQLVKMDESSDYLMEEFTPETPSNDGLEQDLKYRRKTQTKGRESSKKSKMKQNRVKKNDETQNKVVFNHKIDEENVGESCDEDKGRFYQEVRGGGRKLTKSEEEERREGFSTPPPNTRFLLEVPESYSRPITRSCKRKMESKTFDNELSTKSRTTLKKNSKKQTSIVFEPVVKLVDCNELIRSPDDSILISKLQGHHRAPAARKELNSLWNDTETAEHFGRKVEKQMKTEGNSRKAGNSLKSDICLDESSLIGRNSSRRRSERKRVTSSGSNMEDKITVQLDSMKLKTPETRSHQVTLRRSAKKRESSKKNHKKYNLCDSDREATDVKNFEEKMVLEMKTRKGLKKELERSFQTHSKQTPCTRTSRRAKSERKMKSMNSDENLLKHTGKSKEKHRNKGPKKLNFDENTEQNVTFDDLFDSFTEKEKIVKKRTKIIGKHLKPLNTSNSNSDLEDDIFDC